MCSVKALASGFRGIRVLVWWTQLISVKPIVKAFAEYKNVGF
jgi:hypothetical protein